MTAFLFNYTYAKSIEESKIEFKKMGYGDYTLPIKLNDYESFLYVYSLLLNYELSLLPPKYNEDKLTHLKYKCRFIGRMLTAQDFLILNNEFAKKDHIERYSNDQILKQYKNDVGSNCKAINELLK